MKPDISVLVPVRANSKFIAHFLAAFANKTEDHENTELILMVSRHDNWNKDLFEFYHNENIKIIYEEKAMGQRGHHLYLNELASHARGDWILTLCDDMDIVMKGWDNNFRRFVQKEKLKPEHVWVIVPAFVINGDVEFIFSRGYYNACGRLYGYPNGDSWINTVFDRIRGNRKVRMPPKEHMFEDWTREKILWDMMGNQFPNAVKTEPPQPPEGSVGPDGFAIDGTAKWHWPTDWLIADMDAEAEKLKRAIENEK